MLCESADHFNATSCEEIALKAFGPRVAAFSSVMMMCTQLGFVIAYLVILKHLIPLAIENSLHMILPNEISTSATG